MDRYARSTRLAALCCAAAALAACAKSDKTIADTTSTPVTPVGAESQGTVATSSIALADVAGTWKVHAVPTTGTDKTPTDYTLTATGEPTGWKVTFANGQTVTPTVTASGDSIIVDMGPFPSVRRKGMKVTTHSVTRKQGDMLVGTTVAHYDTKGADSVVTLTLEGKKAP